MRCGARRAAAAISSSYDLNRYLAGLGDKAPMHSLADVIKSRNFHPSIQARLESAEASNDVPGESAGCRARDEFRVKLRAAVLKLMDDQRLDAMIYPTWSNPPRLIGDLNTPGGDNNQFFSPSTGFPAITVPMGFTRGDTLPPQRADSARWGPQAAGGPAVLRAAVGRVATPPSRLRIRAGDSPSARTAATID